LQRRSCSNSIAAFSSCPARDSLHLPGGSNAGSRAAEAVLDVRLLSAERHQSEEQLEGGETGREQWPAIFLHPDRGAGVTWCGFLLKVASACRGSVWQGCHDELHTTAGPWQTTAAPAACCSWGRPQSGGWRQWWLVREDAKAIPSASWLGYCSCRERNHSGWVACFFGAHLEGCASTHSHWLVGCEMSWGLAGE